MDCVRRQDGEGGVILQKEAREPRTGSRTVILSLPPGGEILEAFHSLNRGCKQKKRKPGTSNSEPSLGAFSRASLQGLTVEG